MVATPTKPLPSWLEGKKLNKIEQNKANKDGLLVGSEIEEFARVGWENVDETDLQLRLKWYRMFWRPKTPGLFMLRLRVPNGVLNAEQLRAIGSIVARYGNSGSADITTRQNIQLRGVLLEDLPDILERLKAVGLNTINRPSITPATSRATQLLASTHRKLSIRARTPWSCRTS